MVNKKSLLVGMILGMTLMGCAGATFSYKYYGLDAVDYSGTLQGPTKADDIQLSDCKPGFPGEGKCIVMLQQAFYAMKQDYLDTKNQLIECQKNLPPKVSSIIEGSHVE